MILTARCIFFVAIALPAITWTLDRFVLRRKIDWPFMSLLTWIACCIIVWVSAIVLDIGLETAMMSYGLDGDGSVSGAELTPAAETAIDRWQSDVGRNFGVFLAIPIFAIWTAVIYCTASLATIVVRSKSNGYERHSSRTPWR